MRITNCLTNRDQVYACLRSCSRFPSLFILILEYAPFSDTAHVSRLQSAPEEAGDDSLRSSWEIGEASNDRKGFRGHFWIIVEGSCVGLHTPTFLIILYPSGLTHTKYTKIKFDPSSRIACAIV